MSTLQSNSSSPSSLSSDTSSKLFISKTNLGICLAPHPLFLSLHLSLGGCQTSSTSEWPSEWPFLGPLREPEFLGLISVSACLHSLLFGSVSPLAVSRKTIAEASRIYPMRVQKDLSRDLPGTAWHTGEWNKSVLTVWTSEWPSFLED